MPRTVLDVSAPLIPGRVPLYPGDTPFTVERVQARAEGEQANVSRLECSVHAGTHVDAPVHFIDGAEGIEGVPLDALMGPAQVVDATAVAGHIDAEALSRLRIPDDAERILFRTRGSRLWDAARFVEDFPALTEDAAQALVARGVRCVGIDYLSIAPYDDPVPTHVALLSAGVAIIEALDLRRAAPGRYGLCCLPIKLVGSDGAPARVVLIPE